jgi:hypothetical protein
LQLGLLHARASAAASADSLHQLQQQPPPRISADQDSSDLHPAMDPADQILAPIPINSARY